MDGLSLLAMTHELSVLIGGKIDKVQQPERDALLITVRAGGSNYRLLLCAHPENGRVQFTQGSFVNPKDAPMFCMLLRKRLVGARIERITQENADRVLTIDVNAYNDLGDNVNLSIKVELMGRHSNIVLVSEKGIVLDAIKHVGAGMSSVRMLLPGIAYEAPPAQVKQDPRTADERTFLDALGAHGRINRILSGAFFGLSPKHASLLCEKIIGEGEKDASLLSPGEKAALAKGIFSFYEKANAGEFDYTLVYGETGDAVAVYPFVPTFPKDRCKRMESMSTALDIYYEKRDIQERMRRQSASLQKILQNNLERCEKKLVVFEEALSMQESLEELRLYGEIITANLHALSRGMKTAHLTNYYEDPPALIEVKLDERFSAQENAQRYFKRYQKGKAAKALAVTQREETLQEITYIEGQQNNLEKCTTDEELLEIREELQNEGYVKKQFVKGREKKTPLSKPLCYVSSDGIDIYVGKNNKQNDALTLKFAAADNIWLHTKNIPGSHVIIRHDGEPPQATLLEAAMLAAYYSKARASASVPVDYCPKKYVKKPAGAKPGMVIYTTNRTIYTTPDEAKIRSFVEKQGEKIR